MQHEITRSVEQDGRGGRTPEAFPLAARPVDPGLRPFDQPRTLLLRDPAKDRDEERAHGTARVEPRLPIVP
jgi:hypothetical protein